MEAYQASLACADSVGALSVAFPSISTGVYGYPPELAAVATVEALLSATTNVEVVILVAFTDHMAKLWKAQLPAA